MQAAVEAPRKSVGIRSNSPPSHVSSPTLRFFWHSYLCIARAPSGPWDAFNYVPASRTVYATSIHSTGGTVSVATSSRKLWKVCAYWSNVVGDAGLWQRGRRLDLHENCLQLSKRALTTSIHRIPRLHSPPPPSQMTRNSQIQALSTTEHSPSPLHSLWDSGRSRVSHSGVDSDT